jgi:hypothetical protein
MARSENQANRAPGGIDVSLPDFQEKLYIHFGKKEGTARNLG